jgi:hypothetical protein
LIKNFKDGGVIYFDQKNANISFASNSFLNSSAGRVTLNKINRKIKYNILKDGGVFQFGSTNKNIRISIISSSKQSTRRV